MWFSKTLALSRSSLAAYRCCQFSAAEAAARLQRSSKFATTSSTATNTNLQIVTKRSYADSKAAKTVNVHFIDRDGDKKTVKAKLGESLLDAAINNNIDLEGFGACEGTLSCSTCHLILKKEDYKQLKAPTDEENDMLDLAFGLTETSRLGCQIMVDEKMNNWVFVLPKEVSDVRS